MHKKIAYVFTGRTGSTAMFKSYRSHPDDFITEGEFIADIAKSWRQEKDGESYKTREDAWAAQERKIVDLFEGAPEDPRARIFKTKLNDVTDPEKFRALLEKNEAFVVACWRENVVKYVISVMRSEKLRKNIAELGFSTRDFPSNYTADMKEKGIEPVASFPVDPEKLLRRLRNARNARDRVKKFAADLEMPVLAMSYEEYGDDIQTGLDRIRDFTATGDVRLSGQIIKHTPDDLKDSISNFSEIRDALAGTPFGQYLA